MTEQQESRCHRCGTPLRTVIVKVPVYLDHEVMTENGIEAQRVRARYDEREETADCVRCTGAY